MNICPNCGASVHETAASCPACGTPVSAANMNTAQPGMQQQFSQPGMTPQPYGQQYPTDSKAEGWEILLSVLVPVGGLVLYFVNKDKRPTAAKTILKVALIAWGISVAITIFLRVIGAILSNL